MQSKPTVVKKAVQGFKYALFAQIVVLLLGLARSLILPKILTVPDYGYWQIYVFYSSYVGICALGFNDGVYLLYGKYQYNELPFRQLRSATRFYILMLIVFSSILCIVSLRITDENRGFALFAVGIDIFLMGINGLLIYILQITNRMKAYSIYSILDKLILLCAVLLFIFIPGRNYKMTICADVLGKAVVVVCMMISCKEVIWGCDVDLHVGWKEFRQDIKVGISLLIANLMGMLVTGIGRFLVDSFGDISEYAYYSFGMTITNLVLVLITAVSLVLYPTLKRLPEANYGDYFRKLNRVVVTFDTLALFVYFFGYMFIKWFLPQYTPTLQYLNLLFGVVVLQAKMQMVNNTFYKVLREERSMLKANMSCVLFFAIISFAIFKFTKSVWSIALCTFIAMLYRCYGSEIFLRKKLGLTITRSLIFEIGYIVMFVLVTSLYPLWISALLYAAEFAIYVILNGSTILKIFRKTVC